MQTKNPRSLELKYLFIFLAFLLIFPAFTWTAPKKEEQHNNDKHADLLRLIKKLDRGEGVDIEEVISASAIEDCQTLIGQFIRCGEVFEVSPGKIKLLE